MIICSLETKQKISVKAKGRKIHDNSIRAKFKPVLCIEIGVIYESQIEAERQTGVSHKCISACCLGNRITAGGMTWKFYRNGI